MHACMHVCMYVRMYVCMYVCMYVVCVYVLHVRMYTEIILMFLELPAMFCDL